MGSENDKRLKDLAKESPVPTNQQEDIHKSQSLPNNSPNQRFNPYDQRSNPPQNPNQNPLNNNNNPQNNNSNQGFGQNPMLQRSMTQKPKNVITTKILRDAFRNYCIDNNYLNRPRFNDAIESIFRFNIPSMHYTYLSDKIYDLLDSSGDGKIQEDEFLDGFSSVLKDKNYRFLLSMMAMMSLPDKSRDYIEVSEIQEFFFNSYVEAFRHLGHLVKRDANEFKRNNYPVATVKQLGKWARKYEKEVKDYIDKDLKAFFPGMGNRINFEQFKHWIENDHNIVVQYANIKVTIATSLTKLDCVRYEEDNSNKFVNYPSV